MPTATRLSALPLLVALSVPAGCYSDPGTLPDDTGGEAEEGTAASADAGGTSATAPGSATAGDDDGANASDDDDDEGADASDDEGADATDDGAPASTDDGETTGGETTGGETIGGGDESSTGEPVVDASRVVFLLPQVGAPMGYGGIEGADAACQAAAESAGLSGEFLAWLSATNETTPAVRFTQDGGPFVRTDGVVIAEDWADLVDGQLAAPILVTADGFEYSPDAQPESNVATHTNADGTHPGGISPCYGYASSSVVGPRQGEAGATDASWTESLDGWSCDSDASGGPSLYCFAQ